MSNFKKTKTSKAVSVLVSLTTGLWLSGAAMIMPATVSAQTVEELTAQINDLLALIASLQAQLAALEGGAAPSGAVCGYTFATDLKKAGVNV